MNRVADSMRILITGLANSGKTTVCNYLTGSYNLVANYPMTTIEPDREYYSYRGTRCEVIDTPGLNGLVANSEEALLIRRLLQTETPDVIIQCIDANRLKQSLYLTAELLGIRIPLVICLTAVDETVRKGRRIDSAQLARILQVPVITMGPGRNWNRIDLKEAVADATTSPVHVAYSDTIQEAIKRVAALLPDKPEMKRWADTCATLFLTRDPYLTKPRTATDTRHWLLTPETRKRITEEIAVIAERINADPATRLIRERGKWVDTTYDTIVRSSKAHLERYQASEAFRLKAASLSRHPVWGLLFLAVVLGITYVLVVYGAGWLAGIMERIISTPVIALLEKGITSPFWRSLLIGDYGILTLGLFNAIITVLPILSVFFIMLGLLEDMGYLPNLSVLLRRLFGYVGLSGKSIMPIILGFGCKTMATMTTRNLTSRKERLIAIFLIAFAIPCSGQMGLNLAILGRAGVGAFIIAFVILVLVEMVAGAILNRTIRDDSRQIFIQELPPFRVPELREIGRKTGYRLWWFLKEAIPIFIIAALVLFLMDMIGLLGIIRIGLEPLVVYWLGLPLEMVDALILMLAREEAAAGLILQLSRAGMLDFNQSIIAVVVTTMFVPCFANVVAMFREAGTKAAILMLIGINVSTILLAGILNLVLTAIF